MDEKYYEVRCVSGKKSPATATVTVLYSGTDLDKAVDIFNTKSNNVFKSERIMEELKEKLLVTYCFETREHRRTTVTIDCVR